MDHRLNETQDLLKRTAAAFFARQYPLDRLRELQADRAARDGEVWSSLIGLGWTAAPFPEAIGGYPGGLLEAAPLLEEMGHAALPSPYLHSCVAAGLGAAAIPGCESLARSVAAGTETVIWCAPTGLIARPSLADGRLNGRAVGVAWPQLASLFLVPSAGGVVVIRAGGSGVARRDLDTSGAESAGEATFTDVVAEAVLPAGAGAAVVLAGAAGAALMLTGAGARALDLAVEYARMRYQFGRPIGAFQALQHKCADMLIDIEVARGLAYKTAAAHGSDAFPRLARYAKAFAGDAARRVTRNAIQVHGGVGFIDDHKVQLPYRLAMSLLPAYEAAHEHRAVIAAELAATPA